MEKILIANHKMNMSFDEIKNFIDVLSKSSLKPIILPSAIYVPYFIEKKIKTGLQNIYLENSGSYTGEISPLQAKSIGIEYVMVGHSERRRFFGETDQIINLKVKKALENHLKVILCVGEDLNEDYKEVLSRQLKIGLDGVSDEVIISYEPVYSIGSGFLPSNDKIIDVINYIKSFFDYDVKVIYGGSVNLESIQNLKDIEELSGFLIGTSSINIEEFIKIGEVL